MARRLVSRYLVNLGVVCLGIFVLAGAARAEWASQVITLHPGWNSVFLEVQPDDNLCDTVFSGVPIKSVWKWNRKLQIKQFVQNPNELIPKTPDWLIYFPKDEARAFLSDLFAVQAGQPYLVELGGTTDVDWQLDGRVSTATPNWLPDSFNFAGFYLDPAVKTTFKDFLKYDPALDGQAIYRISTDGKTVAVDPTSETLERGHAYWIYTKGVSSYAGPFSAQAESIQGLKFQAEFNEGAVVVKNQTDAAKNITIRVLPSERPSGAKAVTTLPRLAGPVALSYQKLIGWAPIENKLDFQVAAKATQRLPVAIRRHDMAPAAGSKSTDDGQYESVVQVTDGSGGMFNLAATATVDPSPAGLWVGNVTLNKVSEVARPNDLTTTPASSEFTFRIIVHVDDLGNANLLQKVYLLQQEQTIDTSVPPIVTRPEKYLLITQDNLLTGLTGVTIRDGKFVGRRITAPAFSEVDLNNDGVSDPIPMVGNVTAGSNLVATLNVDYKDPLNPFVHRFHPDHDNLDERFSTTLPEGTESYTFQRVVTLGFETQDPQQQGLPEWGDTLLGGTYTEDITGVHKRPIRVQGTFQLSRVSRIAKLNDVP